MSLTKQAKSFSFNSFFFLDRVGVHVLPKHYYSVVPDYSWLKKNKNLWTQRIDLRGVDWNLEVQMNWLERVCRPYYNEVKGLKLYHEATQKEWGPGFGSIESQVLHCVVRYLTPPRIIEIGSGVSTVCMADAVRRNNEEDRPTTEITCIEPYPKPAFKRLPGIQHVQELCQTVSSDMFSKLKAGDMLFIDSSHAVKIGSDVVRIYLEIIPSLAPGVIVHIHDINLPYLYPRDALTKFFGWQETTLLASLMTNNKHLSVLACLSALHYDVPEKLQSLLSDYRPQDNDEGLYADAEGAQPGDFPSSIWLRTV